MRSTACAATKTAGSSKTGIATHARVKCAIAELDAANCGIALGTYALCISYFCNRSMVFGVHISVLLRAYDMHVMMRCYNRGNVAT